MPPTQNESNKWKLTTQDVETVESVEQYRQPKTVRVIILLVTIGMVLIFGLGMVLPWIISIVKTITVKQQDQIRQVFAENYLSSETTIVAPTPASVIFDQPTLRKPFSIKSNPIFQQYGYNQEYMLNRTGLDEVYAIPNTSSSLFAAQTAGVNWSTQGDKVVSDLSKGYWVSSMMIFNKDLSYFKVMPLPKLTDACCNASAAWLGNRYILVNEFVPGIYPPGAGNYFYVGDSASSTANRVFETIPVPESLLSKKYLKLSMVSHPNKNMAALSYCLTRVQQHNNSYCSQFGISIATPQRIVEVLRKNTTNGFKMGWSEANLFIQETENQTGKITTYSFPIKNYENDIFTSELGKHIDPTSKGEPVWIRVQVPITEKVNLLQMDVNFTSTSTFAAYSRAFLTVLLNDKRIGTAYEEQEPRGLHQKRFYFESLPIGTSTLEFRIDPLNPLVKSGPVSIENVRFGYMEFGNQ